MARPKRFELLTPRFVDCGGSLFSNDFSAKRLIRRSPHINRLAAGLQSKSAWQRTNTYTLILRYICKRQAFRNRRSRVLLINFELRSEDAATQFPNSDTLPAICAHVIQSANPDAILS